MSRNDSFNTELFHLKIALFRGDNLWITLPRNVNLFKDRSHAPLVADIVRSGILIGYKLLTLLVDGVIGQVHLQVIQIAVQG